MRWHRWFVLVCVGAAGPFGFMGCSAVLGLGDYRIGDAGASDTSSDTLASDGPASCDVDLTTTCYPCTPSNDPQFLNACTSAMCVPFDDNTRITGLLPDGGLPPVPDLPPDSGADAPSDGGKDGGTG